MDKPSESWVAVCREEDGNRLGDKPEAEEQGERDVERGLLGMVLDREKDAIRQPDGTCDDKFNIKNSTITNHQIVHRR